MKPSTITLSVILVAMILCPVSLDPCMNRLTLRSVVRIADADAQSGKTATKHDGPNKSASHVAETNGMSIGSRLSPLDVRELLALHNRVGRKWVLAP